MEYVKFLYEAETNSKLLGGKATNLIKLHNLGLNIPLGFVLTTDSYKKFLEESLLKEKLFKSLPEKYQPQETIKISNKIKELFLEGEIPKEILAEIRGAVDKIRKIYDENTLFAVRSSANIENSKDISFAGQAESYLYIKTLEDISYFVKNCWASLYSPQALLYLLQMKKKVKDISLFKIKMAVIIQKMVNAQISGVLFTVNVINNNRNQMMINSTWGLGETITDNKIIPDLVIINKCNGKIEKLVIGDKQLKSLPNPKGISTTVVKTEQNLRKICSLNKEQIQNLFNLGIKIEKELDYPQDIEWAIENNKIYTLQSRPITTLDI